MLAALPPPAKLEGSPKGRSLHGSVSWVRSVGTHGRDEAGQAGLRAMGNVCPLLLHLLSPGDEASRDILLEVNDQSLQSAGLIRNKALLVRQCKGADS